MEGARNTRVNELITELPLKKSAAPVVLNRRPARNSEHLQLLWLETSHHFPSASTARSTDQNVPRDDFQNTR